MITLKKDGIYRSEQKSKVHSFLPYLNEIMEVDDDVTFEDFFNVIMTQQGKYSSIFASHLGNYKLNQWEEEWNRIPIKDNSNDSYTMESVGICWCAEIWKYKGDDMNTLTMDIHFQGNGIDDGKKINIAIGYIPINELKSYKFQLNTQLNMIDYRQKGDVVLSGIKEFTVYDVISAVLYEISFSGAPDERDSQMAEINQRYKSVKDGLAELIPAEEVFANIREKIGNLKLKDNTDDKENGDSENNT